jgi:putative membrane protein
MINLKFFIAFLIPFFIGFITEFLGVNYGIIFGTYEYGENLGYKIGGVPLMICVNWAVLTFVTADISKYIHRNLWIRSFIGGLLMMLLDVVIEVSAPRFDFWEFENNDVPIQNYVGWFVISFIAHLLFQQFEVKTNKKLSIHIFVAIVVFFLTFLFF